MDRWCKVPIKCLPTTTKNHYMTKYEYNWEQNVSKLFCSVITVRGGQPSEFVVDMRIQNEMLTTATFTMQLYFYSCCNFVCTRSSAYFCWFDMIHNSMVDKLCADAYLLTSFHFTLLSTFRLEVVIGALILVWLVLNSEKA